jgi:hypothetical protein
MGKSPDQPFQGSQENSKWISATQPSSQSRGLEFLPSTRDEAPPAADRAFLPALHQSLTICEEVHRTDAHNNTAAELSFMTYILTMVVMNCFLTFGFGQPGLSAVSMLPLFRQHSALR